MIDQDSPLQASQASAPTTAVPGQGSGTIRPRGRTGSALALKNWRVRWRLLALIAIPTVTAIR
jgi:hypothetical protein